MTDTAFGTFFLPGPTEVRASILRAMLGPMLPHRSPEFEAIYARIQVGLKPILRTSRPVYVLAASATGLMEAAVRATPPGPVLCCVNGAFSSRFSEITKSTGHDAEVYEVEWGQTFALEEVERRLKSRQFVAVTVVHSETTTGVLSDVRAIGELAHRYGAPILVDSVTGCGGAPLETDAWGLDFVLTGSQKAFALPPGLAFGVASESFLELAKSAPVRGRYLDIVELDQWALKNQTPATPALSLMYALDTQVADIHREGIDARWARHHAMMRMTHDWVAAMRAEGTPLGILAVEGYRSPTVTVVTLPTGITGPRVVAGLKTRGFVIASGYGKLKDTTVRIGHMGDHDTTGLANCLAALRDVIRGA